MELGAFSVSLAVTDIRASKDFYEKLGFEVFGGDSPEAGDLHRCARAAASVEGKGCRARERSGGEHGGSRELHAGGSGR